MIDICMLTCNRARITGIAIEEIWDRTTTPHRLIVLDNGSKDDTKHVLLSLKRFGAVDVLGMQDENKGVHWGHNRLLEQVDSHLYISTDPDIVPQAPTSAGDWLSQLLALMESYPDYAAIACRPHVMIGDNAARMFEDAPPVVERGHVGAVLRLMRADAVREVGGWKTVERPSRNHEERYICGKLRDRGWKVGYARDVYAIHLFGDPEQGEDPWGYPAGMAPQDHGHRPVWPPAHHYGWERMGIDWETCSGGW
jgi:GT2 family glycosyltransferase